MDAYKKTLTHETEANGVCARPELAVAKSALEQFHRIMSECGCLPASRGKVKAVPPTDNDPAAKYFDRGAKIRSFCHER